MFYKGYRFHLAVVAVLLFFLSGFYLQNKYIKEHLKDYEQLHWFLFSYVLNQQFEEFITNTDDNVSASEVFASVDSMIFSIYSGVYSTDEIVLAFTDDNGKLLHGFNIDKLKKGVKAETSHKFYEVTQIEHPSFGTATIKILNLPKKNNRQILLFFHVLWFLICFITLGFLIILWEKQHKAQKIRLDVLNNMVHEFKTPLTSVQLISELIRHQGSSMNDDKLKNYARIIHQESDKMLHQATQLLNTAYYNNIKFGFRMRHHNLHGLTEFFLSSYLSVFNESDIKIHCDFKAKNPICLIDRTHYFNAITNLLDNSRKYSGEKRPEINISTYNENNKLYIEVSDNGIGIEPKHLKHIFDRFYRVPQGNKHEKSGYGVGLYYVKTVLKQMNADIRIKSRTGNGSTFLISIRNKNIHKIKKT